MDFRYEAEAKRGEPMPEELNWIEQVTYQSIALLTARYRHGEITADGAIREMNIIRRNYSQNEWREKYIAHCAQLWVDIELAATTFNKNPTIDNANMMRDVIYGQRRFAEEERKKLLEKEDARVY